MISLVAKMTIQPGKGAEFERRFAEIAAHVRAHEPDTLVYKLVRSQRVADEYAVIEFYRTPDALSVHMANLKANPLMAGLAPLLAAAPDMAIYDDVTSE